jgi:NADH-quinone oxidoreductase subunit C
MPILEKISHDDALTRVEGLLEGLLSDAHLNYGHVDVTCVPENLVEVARRLRDGDGVKCRFFTFLSAVDWTTFGSEDGGDEAESKRPPLEVLIHLYSPEHVIHVTIHVPLTAEPYKCPSISGVYLGALWHERETAEMFGIDFEGHPALVNLYLPEDFEGNPMRKSFKLATRIVKAWPGAKDPEEAGGR